MQLLISTSRKHVLDYWLADEWNKFLSSYNDNIHKIQIPDKHFAYTLLPFSDVHRHHRVYRVTVQNVR